MKPPFYLSPKNIVLLAVVVVGIAFVIWVVRRRRRLVRADLQNRGLMPSKRRRRSRSNEKRNPTLAEMGSGLPPVRETPPPGPTDGK